MWKPWMIKAKCLNDQALQDQLAMVRKGKGRIKDPFFDSGFAEWGAQYCRDCPVRLACLAHAMQSLNDPVVEHLTGIWGGQTYARRKSVRLKTQQKTLREAARLQALFRDTDNPIAS